MNLNRDSLDKLIVAARKALPPKSAPAPIEIPFGFATRVAARWADSPRAVRGGDLWERFCWWGAAASLVVCLGVFSYQELRPEPNVFDLVLDARALDSDLP